MPLSTDHFTHISGTTVVSVVLTLLADDALVTSAAANQPSMSWIPEEAPRYGLLERLLLRVLRCGRVPRHVAFIMDGNRRFARHNGIAAIDGHAQGFDKLAETLQWCKDLGVAEVTVYAFSIENFRRPEAEVEALLALAGDKFRRLVAEAGRLREHGVRVRVIGATRMLPPDLRALIAEAEEATRLNEGRLLNVAFAYTAREEIAQAVRSLAEDVDAGRLEPEAVTEAALDGRLYCAGSDVDLLIRTSGETRLSDFLLWQSAFAVTHFTDVLWPDFTFRNLLAGVFFYQTHRRRIDETRRRIEEATTSRQNGAVKSVEN